MFTVAQSRGLAKSFASATHPYEKEPRDFFRGSDTNSCKRVIQYSRMGVRGEAFSPEAQEKMNKGNILHDYIRDTLIPETTDYVVIEKETESFVEMEQDGVIVKMKSHQDGLLAPKSDITSPVALLEVKTTSSFGFKACLGPKFLSKDHYTYSYYRQSHRYLIMWNATHPEDPPIEQICLFIYNVNGDADKASGAPFIDFWIVPDPEDFEEDIRALGEIEQHIERGTLAPRGYSSKDEWQCSGCQYRNICWS